MMSTSSHISRAGTSRAGARHAQDAPHAGLRGFIIVGLVAVLALFTTTSAARADVGLGTTDGFAILAGQIITNSGSTTVHGDIGIHPGAGAAPNITGYLPAANSIEHTGTLYDADAEGVALQAKADLVAAYDDAAGRTPPILISRELADADLTAGVYASTDDGGDFLLSSGGTLTLTGGADDVWVFQSASTLGFESDSRVVLVGADPCNVFWQVTSSAALGTDSEVVGTIMAMTSISLANGATLEGRALARNGSVTLDSNIITMEACTDVDDTDTSETEEAGPEAEAEPATEEATPEAAAEPETSAVETPERVDTGAGGTAQRIGDPLLPIALAAIGVAAAFRFRRRALSGALGRS